MCVCACVWCVCVGACMFMCVAYMLVKACVCIICVGTRMHACMHVCMYGFLHEISYLFIFCLDLDSLFG